MDEKLRHAVLTYGEHSWTPIAEEIGVNRQACRVRWINTLCKLNRTVWAKEEDEALLRAVSFYKEHIPWTMIAKMLETGRTARQCQAHHAIITKRKNEEEIAKISEDLGDFTLRSDEERVLSDWQDETW
jgi:hypothetical protein